MIANLGQLPASFFPAIDDALDAVVWSHHCGPNATLRVLTGAMRSARIPQSAEVSPAEESPGKQPIHIFHNTTDL